MKKYVLILLISFSFFNCAFAKEKEDAFDNLITSKSVIVYNLNDDEVIFSKNASSRVSIASLTKIMSAIVAFENIANLDEVVRVPWQAFEGLEGYSLAGFTTGDRVTYRDLLYGVLLPSGAEAINTIIYHLGGEDKFINMMNEKASSLGLINTHFTNAIGMDDENHYSSAEDVAKLLKYALKNPEFKTIFTTRTYVVESNNLMLNSTLLKYAGTQLDVSKIIGAKSGFTKDAGVCLASLAKYNDTEYLLINIGSDYELSKKQAVIDTLAIYDYFSENYSYRKVIKIGQDFASIDNKLGIQKKYNIYATSDEEVYMKNDIDLADLNYEYDGVDKITSKNNKGDRLGKINVTYEGEVLMTYDVFLNDELSYHKPWLYLLIVIILLIVFRIVQVQLRRAKRRKRTR